MVTSKKTSPWDVLQQRIKLSLKGNMKDGKWDALWTSNQNDQNNVMIAPDAFCGTGNVNVLICYIDNGSLICENHIRPELVDDPRKKILFYKNQPTELSSLKELQHVNTLEFKDNALEALCNQVNMSFEFAKQPHFKDGFSKLEYGDILSCYHKFLQHLHYKKTAKTGEHSLWIPDETIFSGSTKEVIHKLETITINYTKQIKNIIGRTPETSIKKPLPDSFDELEFWKSHSELLKKIEKQLLLEGVVRMGEFLTDARSPYGEGLQKLRDQVSKATQEAQDIFSYLSASKADFDKIRACLDFRKIQHGFEVLFLKMRLTWENCESVTEERMTNILRGVTNGLVAQASLHCDGKSLFDCISEDTIPDGYTKIDETLEILSFFQQFYQKTKKQTFTGGKGSWQKLNEISIFSSLAKFEERAQQVRRMLSDAAQFRILERLIIGGVAGKKLSNGIDEVYNSFFQAIDILRNLPFDIMDTKVQVFDEHFYEFVTKSKELESILSTILRQAYNEQGTIGAQLKLIDSFETLLKRPLIANAFTGLKPHIIMQIDTLIKRTRIEFKIATTKPPNEDGREDENIEDNFGGDIARNKPPFSGKIAWVQGLKNRLEGILNEGVRVISTYTTKDDHSNLLFLQTVQTKAAALLQEMDKYRIQILSDFQEGIQYDIQEKLEYKLMTKGSETGNILLNFDPLVARLLAECRYLSEGGIKIPDPLVDLHTHTDLYTRQITSLHLITQQLNKIYTGLNEFEQPLLSDRLKEVEEVMQPGFTDVQWEDRDATEAYLAKVQPMVTNVFELYTHMKSNLEDILKMLSDALLIPLFESKSRVMNVSEFDRMIYSIQQPAWKKIHQSNLTIKEKIGNTKKILGLQEETPAWVEYVKYVEKEIENGLSAITCKGLLDFSRAIDPAICQNQESPIIEIKLDMLPGRGVRFTVGAKKTIGERSQMNSQSVWDMCQIWVNSFYRVGRVIKKISGKIFMRDLFKNKNIKMYRKQFFRHMEHNLKESQAVKNRFAEFNFLFEKNSTEEMKRWLKEQLVGVENDPDVPIKDCPKLSSFEVKFREFEEMKTKISKFNSHERKDWLLIDCTPLKSKLMKWVDKWRHTYNTWLETYIHKKLHSIKDFIKSAEKSLQTQVVDLKSLKQVLGYIQQIRSTDETQKAIFKPLNMMISRLRRYNVTTSPEDILLLDNLPRWWEDTVNQVYEVKEAVNPLQNKEVDNIKRMIWDFSEKIMKFRQTFKLEGPFAFGSGSDKDVLEAYRTIHRFHLQTVELQAMEEELQNLALLFELQSPSNMRIILDVRAQNHQLKHVWDQVHCVTTMFRDWNRTLWNDIDTNMLVAKVRALTKRLNSMDKDVKGWKVYQGMAEYVKNYTLVLPLINLLHSDSMKTRHWEELKTVTKKSFTVDDQLSLQKICDLKLHLHTTDVEEVVELSTKEHKINKSLVQIEESWSGLDALALEYVFVEALEIYKIKVPGELLLTLEEHGAELTGIVAQGRYAEFFKDKVDEWLTKLSIATSVIQDMLYVQGKWSNLQAIFLASEDIREQLPEDSKRFDELDHDFKDLMNKVKEESNVVLMSTVEGRGDVLESLKERLERCEKSLNFYLDTKKMAFPRFYFLSNPALLDMLSNGCNNPHAVQGNLGDCFNNLARLEFLKDDSGPTNIAIGMYSKDGAEYVKFNSPFECSGPVEVWLEGLVKHMRKTLRENLETAKFTADQWAVDTPRQEWVFDYCAQIALTTSQIYWSEEVESTFEAQEDGNETAFKEYLKVLNSRLFALIELVRKKLNKCDRTKIITLITVDVHNRDVVQMLTDSKIESAAEFSWQAQMRYSRSDQPDADTKVLVADAVFPYAFEYIGNTGRLCITPLTDRCYITQTQALKLHLGAAPAGPAGTGKTETTKDLGRAIALPVYVFNCSEQMNVTSLGNIFKGLCQTGSWGCFDEFNRIPVEVLSVVATQVGSILDAIRTKKTEFQMMGDTLQLVPSVGLFITMNPGYAGRTELPENLKALFRSCAMVVPDMEIICENMLMAEGFIEARPLAVKFIRLYSLSKELLSKQDHYDWGLRATKAVLRVAGGLKRAEPDIHENKILLRALRDFNLPKLVTQDVPIFLRLVNDLFANLQVSRKTYPALQNNITQKALALGLQAEEVFVRKVVEFAELLEVRHSVFVIGPAGAGKTSVIKVLAGAHELAGEKTILEPLNPKAVKNDELYGFLTFGSGDWKEGLLSTLMRGMSRNITPFNSSMKHKWLILDGDIDAEWIESLNTVMDDNKVLTLVSNERIPVTDEMRLIFEIQDLRNATPATVSRAGILYINREDIGFSPMVNSWLDGQKDEMFKTLLQSNFHKFVSVEIIDTIRKKFEQIVPVSDSSKIKCLMAILDGIVINLKKTNKEKSKWNSLIEHNFYFAMAWAFGGCIENKKQFSDWFKTMFPLIEFPIEDNKSALIFDFFYDNEHEKITRYDAILGPTSLNYDIEDGPITVKSVFISTVETLRLQSFVSQLSGIGKHTLLVGNAGTGKTAIFLKFFAGARNSFQSSYCPLNSYSSATVLKETLEQSLEKRSGRTYGPPGSQKMIFFIDDINMPYVDIYGTQSALALLRQHMDYGIWYDTNKVEKLFIKDIQFVGAMNPTAGSFTINERLMGHFQTFCVPEPSSQNLTLIYTPILRFHLESLGSEQLMKLCDPMVTASIALLRAMEKNFLPSSEKFYYQFNLRDLSAVFQGMMYATKNLKPHEFVRMWLHESCRVYADRLSNVEDVDSFQEILYGIAKSHMGDLVDGQKIAELPNVWANFIDQGNAAEPEFLPTSYAKLNKGLEAQLADYNESNPMMPLVLFEQAMDHVVRIVRILSCCGSALLVGVGGSGKRSLCRLATWICGFEIFTITITRSYGTQDLKEDIRQLYLKAGVKGIPVTFLITETDIQEEKWLIFINDMLSSGEIKGLFPDEDLDGIFTSLRNPAKEAGVNLDDRVDMKNFFIRRVKENLHLVLCFSPSEVFRVRARKFPALVSCTAMDQFFSWPRDALISVGYRFLDQGEVFDFGPELMEAVATHMAEVHLRVNDFSEKFKHNEKRFNYTTPKNYLELVSFYQKMFGDKTDELQKAIQRLEKGIATLAKTEKDVKVLKEDLVQTMKIVEEKQASAGELIEVCAKEQEKVAKEKAAAKIEEDKAMGIADEANAIKEDCEKDLKKAKPALEAAKDAVNCLDKNSLTQLKSFKSPDPKILDVTKCVLILAENEMKKHDWKRAIQMMKSIDNFIKTLKNYDASQMTDKQVSMVKPILAQEHFSPEIMNRISSAAACLATWVVAVVDYNDVYKFVAPKMEKAEEAQGRYDVAMEDLKLVQDKVAKMQAELDVVNGKLQESVDEKAAVEAQAAACQAKLGLANRLVGGLRDEKVRWGESIGEMKKRGETLVGDTLLAAAFVSYVGAFNMQYRSNLWKDTWIPDMVERGIPFNQECTPMSILCNPSILATWQNEGLPADPFSLENGAICCSSSRWPLLIDPQLQGVKWIRSRVGDELKVVMIGQKRWLNVITSAIQLGQTVLIDGCTEDLDNSLVPILSRQFEKRGRNTFVSIAGEEVDFDSRFKLLLATKMSNPHYPPEVFAQCTLVNFMVTEEGLEEQLLAKVVNEEKPELEQQKVDLMRSINEYMVTLNELENDLLFKLSNAPDDILSDVSLVEGLEKTKATAIEIQEKVKIAKEAEIQINEARNRYRGVAAESSCIFFQISTFNFIDHMYQYSLAAFTKFFYKGIKTADLSKNVDERIKNIRERIRLVVFGWVSRGLFERHKLIFTSQLTFLLMKKKALSAEMNPVHFDFLLRGEKKFTGPINPIDWLPVSAWGRLQKLAEIDEFGQFVLDLTASAGRFKDWYLAQDCETLPLPLDWRKLDDDEPFMKLCIIRCMRPDRMLNAIANFCQKTLPNGREYVELDAGLGFPAILMRSMNDADNTTPIFFILSPGSDPVAAVREIARTKGLVKKGMYHAVSMGQGQDKIAMKRLQDGHEKGHWVVLENIHLMPKWCRVLEKKLNAYAEEGSHKNFRIYLSADPSKGIPVGILERCIKLTQEAPQGIRANIKRAFATFDKEEFQFRDGKIKSLQFALCLFHASLIERKKFGPKGWNAIYPFSLGDLTACETILVNKLEGSDKIPWTDFRYIFGEILYGGHITDDWDRLLCMSYLKFWIKVDLFDDMDMMPYNEQTTGLSFIAPPPLNYDDYFNYIDEYLPGENPRILGLHPNSEILVRTEQTDAMFRTIMELQPKELSGKGSGQSPQARVAEIIEHIMDRVGDVTLLIDMEELSASLAEDERGPYQNVFLQESDRINNLLIEIRSSLTELTMGLDGQLTMSLKMETLMNALFMNEVPATWAKVSYPSLRGLTAWVEDLVERVGQLQNWVSDPTNIPRVVRVNLLFNPQSFLTAIMQTTAQRNNLELDKLTIVTDVTRKNEDEVDSEAREGAYISGLYIEGARWDNRAGTIQESLPREMYTTMPVINCKAILMENFSSAGIYSCPTYQTQQRGPTFVFTASLRTKIPAEKWILAGVAMVMEIK